MQLSNFHKIVQVCEAKLVFFLLFCFINNFKIPQIEPWSERNPHEPSGSTTELHGGVKTSSTLTSHNSIASSTVMRQYE